MKFFALLSLLLIIGAPFALFTYNSSFNGSIISDSTGFYQFSQPVGLLYNDGTLYITDAGKGAIYFYDTATNSRIKVIAGNSGSLPVQSPLHMAYDAGVLYIADSLGQAVMTYSGSGYNLGAWASASNLAKPSAISFDANNVYITDLDKAQLLQYSRSTKSYQRIAIDKGPSDGQLSAPQDIKFYKGKYYIVDSDKSLIFVYDQNFTFLSLMGRGRGGVTLTSPRGLDIYDDRIYVADYGNARVVVYSLDGYPIEVLDSSTANATFSYPTDVAVGNGMLYVADVYAKQIYAFSINYTYKNDSVLQLISAANESIQNLNSLQAAADELNITYEKTTAAQDMWMALVDYGNFQFSSSATLAQKALSESDSAQGAITQGIKVKILQMVKASQDTVAPYRASGVGGIKDNLVQFDNRVADINAKISQGSYGAAADAALTLPSLADGIGTTFAGKQAEAASQEKNASFASFSRDYSDLLSRLNSLEQEAQAYHQGANLSSSGEYLNQSLVQAASGDFDSANYSLALARLEISSNEVTLAAMAQQIDGALTNISSYETQLEALAGKPSLVPADLAPEMKMMAQAKESVYSQPMLSVESARLAVASAQKKSADASSISLAVSAILVIIFLIALIGGAFMFHIYRRRGKIKEQRAEEAERAAKAQEREARRVEREHEREREDRQREREREERHKK